jgi:hypothetical protein
MRPANCRALTLRPLSGFWYRAIQPQFWATSLATAHTLTIPSRFGAGTPNRPGFELLYLAEDHQVALFEVQALLGSAFPPGPIVPNPAQPWVIINVSVTLSGVANLCLRRERRVVDTTVQELTGDWRAYRIRNAKYAPHAPYWSDVPTQRLGAGLNVVPDLEGFTTYSSRVPTRRNLVVFPRKLRPGSQIAFSFVDPTTGTSHSDVVSG